MQLAKSWLKLDLYKTIGDIKPGRAGVRAMLLAQNGDTRDDFRIEYLDDSIHVLYHYLVQISPKDDLGLVM